MFNNSPLNNVLTFINKRYIFNYSTRYLPAREAYHILITGLVPGKGGSAMNVTFVFDWRLVLAGCVGAATIIAVSKMDPDALQKTVALATDLLCKEDATKRILQ